MCVLAGAVIFAPPLVSSRYHLKNDLCLCGIGL